MSSEDKNTNPRGATTTKNCTSAAVSNNKSKTQHPLAGRKRPRGGCEDGRGITTTTKREEQQQAYYNRLVHQCRKELHKQAKQTKTFLTQKLIRKLKESTSTNTSSSNGTAVVTSSASSRELQEQKLQQLKDYELEPVLDECFRRLGLCQLDPKLQKISLPAQEEVLDPSKKEDNESQSQQTPETSPPGARNENETVNNNNNNEEDPNSGAGPTLQTTAVVVASSSEQTRSDSCGGGGWIRERILQHSRMMVALEHWNEQVTEYRRWCLQQQERAEGVWTATNTRTKKMPAKRLPQDNNNNNHDDENALVAADHSVFVMLGGEDNEASANNNNGTATEENVNYYGPAGSSDGLMTVKQNRKGQRARRAKAQAVEARKAGRGFRPEESLNWRRSRKQPDHEQHPPPPQQRQQNPSMQNKPQQAIKEIPKEELHPSWQAQKEKKAGIVAFEGKKIRFD